MKSFFCRIKCNVIHAITSVNWFCLYYGQETYLAIKCLKAIYDIMAQFFPHWRLAELPDLP